MTYAQVSGVARVLNLSKMIIFLVFIGFLIVIFNDKIEI